MTKQTPEPKGQTKEELKNQIIEDAGKLIDTYLTAKFFGTNKRFEREAITHIADSMNRKDLRMYFLLNMEIVVPQ